MQHKWKVQKCRKPSLRWIAWRTFRRKGTARVFDTWIEAMYYASSMCKLDHSMYTLSTVARMLF